MLSERNYFLRQTSSQIAQPLAKIFNKSLQSSYYPVHFKSSFVTPIFKKGDDSLVTNYRPVCMSNSIALIFERIVNSILTELVADKISSKQHGFIKKRSTASNLLEYVTFLSTALDGGFEVHSIYTDFSKAFDMVDHDLLISKLKSIGIDIQLVDWFHSYLKNRSLYVAFNGEKSFTFSPTTGVPQGSVLGPLLFSIFINDLCPLLKCHFLLYADDLKIYVRVTSLSDVIRLQTDINALFRWSVNNKIKLNVKKCYFMPFSNKISPIFPIYIMNNAPLNEVTSIRDLGVDFDRKLSFVGHINNIVRSSYRMLGFIARTTTKFKDIDCVKLFLHKRNTY